MLLALVALTSSVAHAADLRGRFGFGFHAGLGSVSALSVRYAFPTKSPVVNAQVELDAGADISTKDPVALVAGGRILYGLVAEDNLSLYVAGGAAYEAAGGASLIRVQPAMGAEFFLFGLENLGLGVEWGFNLDFGDEFRFQTFSGEPAVTVHYWF
jgi:hypothetical protein